MPHCHYSFTMGFHARINIGTEREPSRRLPRQWRSNATKLNIDINRRTPGNSFWSSGSRGSEASIASSSRDRRGTEDRKRSPAFLILLIKTDRLNLGVERERERLAGEHRTGKESIGKSRSSLLRFLVGRGIPSCSQQLTVSIQHAFPGRWIVGDN